MGKDAKKVSEKKESAAKEQKKSVWTKRIICIVAAVAIVATSCAAVFGIIANRKGSALSDLNILTSSNYKINGTMFSYFFNLQYITFQQNYGSYLEQIGLDTSKELKGQVCSEYFSEGKELTWFDYFYNLAMEQATETLSLIEAAKKDNFTLSKSDKKVINKALDEMEDTALEQNMDLQEYLDYAYGEGSKLSDIKTVLGYYQLAANYYNKKYTSMNFSEDEINSFYGKHFNEFSFVDYLSYDCSIQISQYSGDKIATNAAKEDLRKAAEDIKNSKTPDEYKQNLTAYIKKLKGSGVSQTDIDTEINNATHEKSAYDKNSDVLNWAFDRSVTENAVKTFETDDGKTFTYTVAMIIKPAHKDESVTRDIRHILIKSDKYDSDDEAKAVADKVFDEWNKSDKTVDTFSKMANKYSDDTGSQNKGGLYTGVTRGQMVEAFDSWMFDEARKKGDSDIVKSEYGYHIMYYPGVETMAWQSSVKAGLVSEVFEKDMKAVRKTYSVKKAEKEDKLKELLEY